MRARANETSFSALFDRAAAACAKSQRVVAQSASAVSRARLTRASTMRLRRTTAEALDAWTSADAVHSVLRGEVERVAHALRAGGMDRNTALATVRAHLRFVLYDGGLTEQDAEPVVQRATAWVNQIYHAA